MPKIITSKILKSLNLPKPNSHKRQNGRLLVIAGSDKYHGALLYCLTTASRLVDLVYVLTTPDNQQVIKKLKTQTAEFMAVKKYPDKEGLTDVDCVLIGPGLGTSSATKKLVKQALASGKKLVLDADALNVLDREMLKKLSAHCILTPHAREFKKAFGAAPTKANVLKVCKKYHCTVILKGRIDIIGSPDGSISKNITGNAGMTKGGTGDVLAGLVAGLFCNNDALTSASAAAFVNSQAGDDLYKQQLFFYNAEDLSRQIPLTLKRLAILPKKPR